MKKSRLFGAVSASLFALVTTLRTSLNTIIASLVLLVSGCLVATTVNAASIQRMNLDGSGVTVLVTGLSDIRGIALDVVGGQMYWTDLGNYIGTHKIQRANLDGSGVTDLVTGDLVTGFISPRDIALDVGGGQMYWADPWTDKIQRANLDGSGVTDLVTGLSPLDIALDIAGGHMYWVDISTHKIQRANLDGSGVTDLMSGLARPSSIALDVGGGQMYWTDAFAHKIQRANLDGSGVTDLVTGLPSPVSIALDVGGGLMYWVDPDDYKIQRANLDGSGVTVLMRVSTPSAIALDLEAGHIYFGSYVPLPASVFLFAPGLAILGFVGWRRKRAA